MNAPTTDTPSIEAVPEMVARIRHLLNSLVTDLDDDTLALVDDRAKEVMEEAKAIRAAVAAERNERHSAMVGTWVTVEWDSLLGDTRKSSGIMTRVSPTGVVSVRSGCREESFHQHRIVSVTRMNDGEEG